MKRFDRKFGVDYLAGVPSCAGVYRMLDASGVIIYVGKAKNLRRRLAQYRNAKRCRRHYKMRSIVTEAVKVEWTPSPSELEALLEETRLIQQLRPKWNKAGAFSFLYPLVGMKTEKGTTEFLFTTTPDAFLSDYQLFGAFRSRHLTGEGFFALMKLMAFVGKRKIVPHDKKRSYVFGFRQLPESWPAMWEAFFRGESPDALGELSLNLLEKSSARAVAETVQEQLKQVKRFWKHEAKALAQAITSTGYDSYPVSQIERDPLFLRYRGR